MENFFKIFEKHNTCSWNRKQKTKPCSLLDFSFASRSDGSEIGSSGTVRPGPPESGCFGESGLESKLTFISKLGSLLWFSAWADRFWIDLGFGYRGDLIIPRDKNELLVYGMSASLIFSTVFLQVNWRRNNGSSIWFTSYSIFQKNPRKKTYDVKLNSDAIFCW